MKAFVIVIALAVLFVLGPLLAMRPSPRQAQLARLRARATAAGLRVRVSGARTPQPVADYVLPWRLADNEAVRGLHVALHRDAEGRWEGAALQGAFAAVLGAACSEFPPGVSGLRSADEGLAAEWNEKGRDEDVDRIAAALQRLRAAITGEPGDGSAARDGAGIRT